MAERSEGKEKYEFIYNLNDGTNLLEEMVKQDERLITRSSSNLNNFLNKFLNNSSNVNGMEKFINEKNYHALNKPAKCSSMDSQQNLLIIY